LFYITSTIVVDVVANLGSHKLTLTIKHADFPLDDQFYTIQIPANTVNNTSEFKNDAFLWSVITRGYLLYVSAKDIKAEMKIKIYPNPTSTLLSIESYENTSISIFSIDGRLLLTKRMETGIENIDVKFLLSGMYLLRIENKQSQKNN